MKAMIYEKFGGPEVLQLRDVEKPEPAEDEVLVRVHAASVNPFDWHMLTGMPYLARIEAGLRKPKTGRLGVDFAGTVDSVGADVTRFKPGDEVFGGRTGAFAEYVPVREERAIALKPPGVSFEHAAAVGIAGVTALQGLRDKGRLHEGQHVLINGASGGVGTWGLQIAKAMGGEVTAVCSPRNVEQARQLGADRVIDYTEQDFTQNGRRYDLLLDIGGNRSWPEYKRALNADGTIVIVGGPKTNRWIGPLWDRLLVRLRAIRDSRTVAAPFLASLNGDDLRIIGEWMESGNVTPAIERTYPLSEVPQALAYVGEGHARGKVVISIRES
jgi:NADPH:quinone reductase-like Zn-dependent oxidoreductase